VRQTVDLLKQHHSTRCASYHPFNIQITGSFRHRLKQRFGCWIDE
jgi:hypothetical protein